MASNSVLAISIAKRTVTLLDGQVIPVTNWFCGKEELGGPEHATAVVAGPCADGKWYSSLIMEEDRDGG